MGAFLRKIDGGGDTRRPPPAAKGEPSGGTTQPAQAVQPPPLAPFLPFAPSSPSADDAQTDDLFEGVTELHARLGPARKSLGALERARHLAAVLRDQLAAPGSRGARGALGAGGERAHAMAEDLGRLLDGAERTLSSALDQIDRELVQVRYTAEQLRLRPATTIFTTLERTARDAGHALGKRVAFEGSGGEVRLDARALVAVQGALVQIVRNAVAHGIETESERTLAGKPATGKIKLEVARRGRLVAFAVSDDGRGVDVEAVRRAAARKGLLPPEPARFRPKTSSGSFSRGGMTTSTTVTEVAGRGVGLDVVRDAAERLGGRATMRTKPGEGTVVELVVPILVASVEGLQVEAGGLKVIVPLSAVERTLRLGPGDVARTPEGEIVVRDGRAVPYLLLSRALVAEPSREQSAGASSGVVIRGASGVAILGVDRLLGTSNVVVRPLPALAPTSPVVMGAALDAEGNPRLVVDPDELIAAAARYAPRAPVVAPRRAPILVVDDSLTTRMLERSILESAGYDVDMATSGEEALDKARATKYGLFLVDVEMPGMDGFTFVEQTRADGALREIPAILVSSRASEEDRRRGSEVGALAYMVKSEFDQGALLGLIRGQVG